tara:strand:- start:2280 stop:2543 length:264 start_codon:yes stop_codon:yes gene_type:complete
MSHAKDKAPQKEVSQFRMGTEKKHKEVSSQVSIRTKLIRKEGGYGGFQRKYNKNPFNITREEAKRLIKRNQECFCASGKKYKKCCLK